MPSNDQLIHKVRRTIADLGVMQGSKILAGVSGGVDSMVLATVLKMLGYELTVSHINFCLRGLESDMDAQFVAEWCANNNVPFYLLETDAEQYAIESNLNIQSAAREIRYNLWEENLQANKFDFVATGHHHDDSVETFFMNAIRGTGMKGLIGIPSKRNSYIRPLIHLMRDEIEMFAKENNIEFRTDSSNTKDNYRRNQIRHHLIPVVKEISSESNILGQTLHRLNVEWDAWNSFYTTWKENKVSHEADGFHIAASPFESAFVLRWLEEKGFPWQLSYDYVNSIEKSGSVLVHNGYRLSKTKEGFHLAGISEENTFYIIEEPGTYTIGNFSFSILPGKIEEYQTSNDPTVEFINKEVVKWPLRVRNIKPGDSFQPLGMSGKSKKLQDFMVDLKLEPHEKANVRVLESNEHIIWVMGKRLDERAKVKDGDVEVFELTYSPLIGE